MFDQNLAHAAGDRLSVRCQKHAKSDSQMSAFKPWHRATLIVVLAGLAVALLAWIARTDPAINYLPRHRDAEWIVFPTAVDARAHWCASLDVTFRREFVLANKPATARLRVRALRRAEVKVNGVSVQLPPNPNWKNVSGARKSPEQLHAGANIVEVRVFNHNGPPALWLALNTDQLIVRTDESWEVIVCGFLMASMPRSLPPQRLPGPAIPLAGDRMHIWCSEKDLAASGFCFCNRFCG